MKPVTHNKQRGVVLVIALIALLAISLAGIALMRTVDTSNVVSGNIAFNEAAIQVADIGAEQAYGLIMGIVTPAPNPPNPPPVSCTNTLTLCPKNSAGQYYFYPNVAAIDSNTKLPTPAGGLFWSDAQNVALPGETAANASYSVKYVAERMCGTAITGVAGDDTASFLIPATFAKCRATPIYNPDGTITANSGKLFWRVTVQASGPRNTTALAQYFYGIQDTVN